jgi:hypothetical protein
LCEKRGDGLGNRLSGVALVITKRRARIYLETVDLAAWRSLQIDSGESESESLCQRETPFSEIVIEFRWLKPLFLALKIGVTIISGGSSDPGRERLSIDGVDPQILTGNVFLKLDRT